MVDDLFVKKAFLWVLVIGLFILAFLLLKPIIIPILLALLLAYIFLPVYKRINSKIKNKNISAFLLIIGITVVITVPLIYITPTLVRQTFDTYQLLQNFDFSQFISKSPLIQGDVATIISNNIDNIVSRTFSTFLSQFAGILSNLPSLLLKFAVFIFTFFFAIRDSKELSEYFSKLSPFSAPTESKFMKEFRGITNAIIFGQIIIGLIQGLALGAGLFFLGVPKALTLTFIACIVSMIPVLGSWIVWLPVGALLLVLGQTFSGIFMLLYGALFVSVIDNVLRPYFLSRQSNLPIAVGVIGTIGGLYLFGIVGLLLGPLILAYVLIIIDFYQQGKLNELFRN